MAKRFAIFVLLGPVLVWLMFFLPLVPEFIRRPDSGALTFVFLAIVLAAVLAFVPAFLIAWIDHAMAGRAVSRPLRAAICAPLGAVGALAVATISLKGLGVADDKLLVAAFGAVPAAICSWLAGAGNKSS